MDADITDLMRMDGVKENTATFLKLIPEAGKRYQIDKFTPSVVFDDLETVAEYCVYSHLRDTEEEISVMMMDARMRLLGNETLAKGNGCDVYLDMEKLGGVLFRYNAVSFIIVHSHPGGEATPSDSDVVLTQRIYSLMKNFNKTLVEHIIIADGHYVPIIHHLRAKGYDFYSEG
jgi:DNA repair protein RadC